MKLFSLLFLTYLLFTPYSTAQNPLLQTNIGEFEGKTLEFDDEQKRVDAFYGLPFAKKPKRFEKPQPPEPFDERRSALKHKPACTQLSFRVAGQLEADEDCLYLNLFKPHQKSPNSKGFPLIFFVHGGGYQGGSAPQYSLDYMAEHYVTKGVVYVAVQYRLGVFGLASNGDSQFPGNYALWDVRQALLWVRENAQEMDVDLERITLWGYSAGASVVSHMSLSEQTRNLFSQVIQMSGGSFNDWSLCERTVDATRQAAKILGCYQQDSEDLKECLRSFDDVSLLDAVKQIPNLGLSVVHNKFAPRLDHDFLSTSPWLLLDSAPPKPTLSTMLENEALVFVAYDLFRTSHWVPPLERENFNLERVENMLKENWVTKEGFGEKTKEVIDKILDFYVHRHPSTTKDFKFYLTEYSRFVSDQTLAVAQMREMLAKLEHGWPLYNVLNVHNENLKRTYPNAVSSETVHGGDIPFLLGSQILGDLNFTKTDKEYRDRLVGAIVQFVKTGNPSAEGKNDFVRATRERPFAYTELSHERHTKDGLFKESVKFWDQIVEQYEFDIFCPSSMKPKKISKEEL